METTENQTSKDRLLLFIEHLGIGQTKFEKLCGLSNGYVSNVSSVSFDILLRITKRYPELSAEWVKDGVGEMLRIAPHTEASGEVEELCGQMKIAPLVPVDITRQPDVRVWDYVSRHKDLYDRIPDQMMPRFDLIHTVRSNVLAPAIEKGDVLFLQHLDLSTDSVVNGHIYFLDTRKNGIVVKKVFIEDGKLQCFSLSSKVAVKSFALDDLYDIFSVVALLKTSIPNNDYLENREKMLGDVIEQNSNLVEELSAQRKIIESLIKPIRDK